MGSLSRTVRGLGALCHLTALAWIPLTIALLVYPFDGLMVLVLGALAPWLNLVFSAIVWWVLRRVHPFIDRQGREVLNLQLSFLLYVLLGLALVIMILSLVGALPASEQNSDLIWTWKIIHSVLLIVTIALSGMALAIESVFAVVLATRIYTFQQNDRVSRYILTIRFLK